MTTDTRFYATGGMPSNFQVCGVRQCRLQNIASAPLVAADVYPMFDFDTDEVVVAYGLTVLQAATDAGAVTATVSDGTGALAALTSVNLKTVGTTAGVLANLNGAGLRKADTLSVVITGVTTGVDFEVYAVVAKVKSLMTYTEVDTIAP